MTNTMPVFLAKPRFEPERFFSRPTKGRGLVQDFYGRVVDRCEVTTRGWWDHRVGAMLFDETLAFDDGRTESQNWTFRPDPQGTVTATEPTNAGPGRAWADGESYRMRFRRLERSRLGAFSVTYDVRLSMETADTVRQVTRAKMFGVTVGMMTAVHRRVAA